MLYQQNVRLYYHDTDSYGVMWHGACVKWFEEGRIELCERLGLSMKSMDADGIVFPVVDVHIRYKASAVANDNLVVETTVSEFKTMRIVFKHVIKNAQTNKINVVAETTVVPVNKQGNLIKDLPENMQRALKSAIVK